MISIKVSPCSPTLISQLVFLFTCTRTTTESEIYGPSLIFMLMAVSLWEEDTKKALCGGK